MHQTRRKHEKQRSPSEPAPLCDMGLWRKSSAQLARLSPDDFSISADHLSEAEKKVKPGKQSERLAMVEAHFEQSQTLFESHHTVKKIFSGETVKGDLKSLLADLQANSERSLELRKKIQSTKEWSLGAGQQKDLHLYKTTEHKTHSGMLTAMLRLRTEGKTSGPKMKDLPDLIQPLGEAKISSRPVRRIKAMTTGWYYAMPDKQHLFEPMKVTSSGNELRAVKNAHTPVIEGRGGEFEQHWSFALVPWLPKRNKRHLFRFDFELNGANGALKIFISNPRLASPGDGLPINAAAVFSEKIESKKMTIVVEPVTPQSRWFGHIEGTAMRFGMLFTPSAKDAECKIVVRISKINLHHDANDDIGVSLEDFVEELNE